VTKQNIFIFFKSNARKVQFGQSNFLCFIIPTDVCYYSDYQKF